MSSRNIWYHCNWYRYIIILELVAGHHIFIWFHIWHLQTGSKIHLQIQNRFWHRIYHIQTSIRHAPITQPHQLFPHTTGDNCSEERHPAWQLRNALVSRQYVLALEMTFTICFSLYRACRLYLEQLDRVVKLFKQLWRRYSNKISGDCLFCRKWRPRLYWQ